MATVKRTFCFGVWGTSYFGDLQTSITGADTPGAGIHGSVVTISGSQFTGSGTVTFNGTAATPTQWSATSITTTVRPSATSGPVVVTAGGQASTGVPFAVMPFLASLSQPSGSIGQVITIQGSGFGSSQGGSAVTFNGIAAGVSNWSSTSLTATVPVGATTGPVVVTAGGYASNGLSFTVQAVPQISAVLPQTGAVGQGLALEGTNFGATPDGVTLNGVPATILDWTPRASSFVSRPGCP